MLERLYECFGTEERIGLICHINGMEMGWMNFVIENIYEEGDVVRVETGDSYIRLEPKLYEEVPVGEGEKFVHGEYSNAIVHAFQGFRAPFSGKIVHIFPEQSAAFN